MKKNDLFQVEIEDMSAEGLGVGHVDGMTFFIKDALVGDVVEALVMKLKKHYGYGRLRRVLQPSVYRVEPRCPLERLCGGCQLQALSYPKQLELKQQLVRENLQRIGGFSRSLLEAVTEPIVGMEDPYRYRNKAQYPVGRDREGNLVMGFYAARSHRIVPVEDCLLGVTENAAVLRVVKEYMETREVMPYDETSGQGLIRHVLIRKGFHTGELMVCLVINGECLPDEERLCEMLAEIPGMKSISLNVNRERTNVILGEKMRLLWGEPTIGDVLYPRKEAPEEADAEQRAKAVKWQKAGKGVSFRISPKSFYQVNPVQTEKLYSLVLEYADLTGEEIIWDLYCGIGTISLFLAGSARRVYGVEVVPEAVEDARENAVLNGIENAVFFQGRAEEVFSAYAKGQLPEAGEAEPVDVVVVDPPRKGCDPLCLETILAMSPKRVVYVSCDPATLARDLRILCEGGYELRRVRPVDQFCQGMHVETVVLMSQVKN